MAENIKYRIADINRVLDSRYNNCNIAESLILTKLNEYKLFNSGIIAKFHFSLKSGFLEILFIVN